MRAAPPERGWLAGTVELEPDELRGDNVRHFAVWIGPAPGVARVPRRRAVREERDRRAQIRRSASSDGHDIASCAADELTTLPALIIAPERSGAARRGEPRARAARRAVALRRTSRPAKRRRAARDLDGVNVVGCATSSSRRPARSPTRSPRSDSDAWIVAGARYVIVGVADLARRDESSRARVVRAVARRACSPNVSSANPGRCSTPSPAKRLPRPRWADAHRDRRRAAHAARRRARRARSHRHVLPHAQRTARRRAGRERRRRTSRCSTATPAKRSRGSAAS